MKIASAKARPANSRIPARIHTDERACSDSSRFYNYSWFNKSENPRRSSIMALTLTEKAADEIKRIRVENKVPDEFVLRVGVRAGGCSGFDYAFNFDDNSDVTKDFVTEQHGVKLAVEKRFDLYLDGTEIDFVDDLNRRGFKFNNPNAQKTCGCGSSFSV